MATRAGMSDLITELRSLTNAGVAETFHGVTYWTDEQLETILDKHRYRLYYPLVPVLAPGATSRASDDHTWKPKNRAEMYEVDVAEVYQLGSTVDQVAAGMAAVIVGDNLVTFDDAYTAKAEVHHIYLYAYDINAAAAEVWEKKAAHRDNYTETKAGHHTFHLNDERNYCLAQARRYRARRIKAFELKPNRYSHG